jgi:hypothetical protein
MRRNAAFLMLTTLVAGAAPALQAQGRDRGLVDVSSGGTTRGGVYFTGALGAGMEQCKFETAPCGVLDANGNVLPSNGDTWRQATTTPSFALRLGGTLSPNARLGVEGFGWSADNGPTTESTFGLLLSTQIYPAARSGFYVKGGAGIGWSSVSQPGFLTSTESGFLFNVGLGYDVPISRNVFIAPMVDYYQGSYPGGVGEETLSERIFFFGASLTFQSRHRRF